MSDERRTRSVRFDAFELDVRAGELRKNGTKIRLQEQPFQVLLMLLERPGEVVLREEIRKKLWPNDTIVEFAPSINAAIQRLREALGDSAEEPRYVETVARRGYRFIGELVYDGHKAQPVAVESIAEASDLTGRTIAHYRVFEKLGRGGMGEVYRARDTKLGREVALKVLPEEFSRDADRMARFEREAQVLASLNHPNIASIYGVENASGIRALVMELVEGKTLAEQIARKPVPLEEALGVAQQMADALEAAHAKGIVHRDLKPANVKITPQGVVKVLDFGLATVAHGSTAVFDDPENSPTRTATLSQAGAILGTAAYMAPEQARGEAVDKRADIWAFGAVLYEMLTGRRLFEGETTTEILSAVLTKEPEWGRAPAKAQRLLRRCLEKDPGRRLRDIGEIWFLLEEAPQIRDLRHTKLIWALVCTLLALMLTLALLYIHRPSEETRLLKLSVLPPPKAAFSPWSFPAVSPDGRHLAYLATVDGRDSLWVRDLDSLAARPLPGAEDASHPFWSPDSRFIAFFAGSKLKKIDMAGGPPLSLCDGAPFPVGGSWGKNDVIVFATTLGIGLFRVPAAGGTPTPVTAIDPALGETAHVFPWFLPDGRHFLYTSLNRNPEKTAVYAAELDSKSRRRVLASDSSNVVYAPPGYLLFQRERHLMAQPFNADRIQTTGDAGPIAEGVEVDYLQNFLYGSLGLFSASQNGVLAYLSGSSGGNLQLTWFDRSGKAVGTVGVAGIMEFPEISPDGNTVAVDRLDPQTGFYDLWLHDLKRGTESRFTFNSKNNDSPEWSPDGSRIVFSSTRDGVRNLYQKATSSTAPEEALLKSAYHKQPSDWTRDGRYIIYGVIDPKTKDDIWVLPLFGDRKPFPYLQTEFKEDDAKLSPDGRWLAYESDETRRLEIYVRTFPSPGSKWQVSTNGGENPAWSPDGKELFFLGADNKKMMVVEVKGGSKFEASVPKPLFDMPTGVSGWFAVGKDGRFLIPAPVEQASSVPMTVVVNWTAGLKK